MRYWPAILAAVVAGGGLFCLRQYAPGRSDDTAPAPSPPDASLPAGIAEQTRRLSSTDPMERALGAAALGRLGNRAAGAIPALAARLGDGIPVRLELPSGTVAEQGGFFTSPGALAARALAGLGPSGADALVAALGDSRALVRRHAVEGLSQVDADWVVPRVIDRLADDNASVRRAACQAVAARGPAASRALLAALTAADPQRSPSQRAAVRAALLRAAGLIDDEGCRQAAIAALQDPDLRVRRAALDALWRARDRRATRPLLAALTDDTLHRDAAATLAAMDDPDMWTDLVAALADSPEWRVRRGAAYALSALRDPRAVEPLIAALGDDRLEVRREAAVALGRIADRRAIRPLVAATAGDCRDEALRALQLLTGEGLTDPRQWEAWCKATAGNE